ncbi:hypothetical protein M406DRAFT_347123 [Cryphonectria parasitica EP155]|uniref:Zn(2)-C6 fungal-type domain-containing protein n=1 Tax=Cryphonectria parasitica (strain ATCC 38755 / EP155) TaxID=660469 RepID=A0A9P5CMT2_CRYP1|nr:uncharacterized protein M406DRAFT_347123 [Cryphonectria parasitica EP155]KAF3763401.1 hypothetical protein M406DRAFT_347123 [Cryphonectria parasitica EP155]
MTGPAAPSVPPESAPAPGAGGHGGVSKRKFAAPPVKSACLSCRAARTRCDGGKPCATCQNRNRECVYLPSRRGGPRPRKKPRPEMDVTDVTDEDPNQIPSDVFTVLSQEPADAPRAPISIQDYIDPGAGLKQLQDWVPDSDFIFDSLFLNGMDPTVGGGGGFASDVSGTETPAHVAPMVRTYQSDAAILEAYYVFIHPFLPILPPPFSIPVDRPVPRLQDQLDLFEGAYEPSSAVTLAISAVLALIPCPEDPHPQTHESQLFRRKYAQFLAQSAFETIESDEEIPDSSIEPPRALSEEPKQPFRRPLHPQVPLELERIVALCVLSIYEYAQRGNLKKMQNRAGQALMSAMDLSLHSCTVRDEFTEARRRAWWMSYVCVAQGSIVSNTKPSFLVLSPSYTAEFPTFLADPEAFTVFMQAQRAILAATQFVIELNKALKENADMKPIFERMRELEALLAPLLARSEGWLLPSTTTSPVDPAEGVVARSLRCMASIKLNSARIKVHRYCAFFDIPVFSRKHCDLKPFNSSSSSSNSGGDEPRQWPACSCSTFVTPYAASTTGTVTTPSGSSLSAGLSPTSSDGTTITTATVTTTQQQQQQQQQQPSPPYPATNPFPFSSHQSARTCLKCALDISRAFEELPYPIPTGAQQPQGPPVFLSPTSGTVCPRTMPSFACCAMQCAYALLMVHQKTRALYSPNAAPGVVEGNLLIRLQQGLTSIYATLSNYAMSSEALGGMRDQIKSAIEDSTVFVVG